MALVGIDLGTTSVKICLLSERKVVWEKSVIHNASGRLPYGIQSAKTIVEVSLQLLQECISLCEQLFLCPSSLHIAGQMHGIVFWKQNSIENGELLTELPLYTWLYSNKLDIDNLPRPSQNTVHRGFGSVTFLEKRAEYGSEYDRCGTIMDLLACILTGSSTVYMSEQLAMSWGYCSSMTWDHCLQESEDRNIKLPTIVANCADLGKWKSFQSVEIRTPIGDLQASIASVRTKNDSSKAYLVLGTSAQLCVVSPRILADLPASVAKLPYTDTEYLYAACSMNGGNAVDNILSMLENFFPEESRPLFDRSKLLNQLDNELISSSSIGSSGTFIAERNVLGFVGLQLSNLKADTSILEVLQSVCNGVVDNLFQLFPVKLLEYLGVRHLVLVGGAKNNRYRRRINVILRREGDIRSEDAAHEASAALGAILFNN